MTTKRAYKLQEFVAHSSNVNCLKIGRRTSRVLVTGGEDHKVNLWAIGKPNAIMSLSGHTSAVESVSFDSSELLVAAGAASGSIKLWDLEESKIIRTLTGHRSNCVSVDFHPFGEFFASGSLDTNLKIWDIRRKGCIHTYKGHTRGVNSIRFTPDGRWVVSGGEDNAVKLWDLTAGKLLHDFKGHEGQIQCIDFHPHEFLLATGSADKSVKFWDLETFELIGSAGPENSGVRSMTFNPDGRTLLCGLHESLKVFSWEPVRCHDSVDVGWSKLLDMNVHEGKLLGCSYNQSCVGVWVVDISRLEPYAVSSIAKSNGPESKSSTASSLPFQTDNSLKASVGRLTISQNSDALAKETKPTASTGIVPGTPQRIGVNSGTRMATVNSSANSTSTTSGMYLKRNLSKGHSTTGLQTIKSDVVPVIVPRTSTKLEPMNKSDSTKSESFKSDVVPVIVPRASTKLEPMNKSDSTKSESLKSDVVCVIVPRSNTKLEPINKSDSTKIESLKSDVVSVIVPRTSTKIEPINKSDVAPSIVHRTSTRIEAINKSDAVPAMVPRTFSRLEPATESRKENIAERPVAYNIQSKPTDSQRPSSSRDGSDRMNASIQSGISGNINSAGFPDQNLMHADNGVNHPSSNSERSMNAVRTSGNEKLSATVEPSTSYQHETYDMRVHKSRDSSSFELSRGGRTRTLVQSWETRERSPRFEGLNPYDSSSSVPPITHHPYSLRGRTSSFGNETVSASDEDAIADLLEYHGQFIDIAQSRLRKLQVVLQLWERKDVKGLINALEKMSNYAISADVISVLLDKSDIITLDLCTCLLPLLTSLLDSGMDRHLAISLEMLLKLIKTFGPVIYSTLSAGPSVGVDLQAEQRMKRCNLCFIELEKVKHVLFSLTRRGGSIAKSAQELSLTLQEVTS